MNKMPGGVCAIQCLPVIAVHNGSNGPAVALRGASPCNDSITFHEGLDNVAGGRPSEGNRGAHGLSRQGGGRPCTADALRAVRADAARSVPKS